MRIESAHKINRTRDDCFVYSIKSCRVHQGLGSVETIQGTEPAGQLDGFAARKEEWALAFLQCTGNDCAGADSRPDI